MLFNKLLFNNMRRKGHHIILWVKKLFISLGLDFSVVFLIHLFKVVVQSNSDQSVGTFSLKSMFRNLLHKIRYLFTS